MKKIVLLLCITTMLTGCDTATQTTSGKSYLAKYKDVPTAAQSYGNNADMEKRIREVAAVEPILQFPARIGLARIDDGKISAIPQEEAESWKKAQEKLGNGFGEFIPLNPLVAAMVAGTTNNNFNHPDLTDIINEIRLGAARQHLDAVLIYEVFSKEQHSDNILSLGKVTIIGGYLLPSENHDAQGFANGLLIDVIQGYPYGSIQTVLEKESRVSSAWGWGSQDRWNNNGGSFSEKVKTEAAKQLTDKAYDMFIKLRAELAEKRLLEIKR